MSTPPIDGMIETSLYVENVERAHEFYTRVFGFDSLFSNDRAGGVSVAGEHVLLFFRKGATSEPITDELGTIPPHGADGQIHFAFKIPPESLDDWRQHFAAEGVEIIAENKWARGGHSIYFHDPDGHVGEIITPGCWEIY